MFLTGIYELTQNWGLKLEFDKTTKNNVYQVSIDLAVLAENFLYNDCVEAENRTNSVFNSWNPLGCIAGSSYTEVVMSGKCLRLGQLAKKVQ